ncbi:hypothetical protein [Chondromyces apiculatus]|uniref:hypothetical protein n=1 Tax=Chondromyces apiculatus TaxID=51 RepID=UPI0012DC4175|nr:hypothetical protein [Chondromyces apiculatus]
MSLSGWMACHTCRTTLWLGKAVHKNYQVIRFHAAVQDVPLNSDNTELNRALWKFLADHARHNIQVIVEGDQVYLEIGEYVEVGGEQYGDIPFDEYLKGWGG